MAKKTEEENSKVTKKKSAVQETVEKQQDQPKGKQVVRERIEKGPNGETIRIRETIIEEDDDETESSEKLLGLLTNKKFIIGIVGVLVILLIVVMVLVANKPKPIDPYVEVEAVKGDIYTSLDGGQTKLSSSSSTIIKSPISKTTTVTKVHYKKNETVKEGQVLIELDSSFASEEVRNLESAISSMQKMLELYKRKQEELSIKANSEGYIASIEVVKDAVVSPGQILGYYIPTTTFKVEYNVTYDPSKMVKQWQPVNIKVAETETITGIVYNVDSSTMEQGYVKVGVYVNDSPINLSGLPSTAEVVTATGNVNSEGVSNFWQVTQLPIYATQEGTITSGNFEVGKKFSKGEELFYISNDDISSTIKTYTNDIADNQNIVNYKRNEVNDFIIKAPVSGIIESEPVNIGDSVYPNKELATMKTTGLVQTTVYVTKEEVEKIEINDKVVFTITGEEEVKVTGKVTYAEIPRSTDVEKKYEVNVKIHEDEVSQDIIDKNAKVEIVLEEATNVIYVPKEAIIVENNKKYIEVKDEGSYEAREIQTGLETNEYIAIIDNLNEGEVVRMPNPELKQK